MNKGVRCFFFFLKQPWKHVAFPSRDLGLPRGAQK